MAPKRYQKFAKNRQKAPPERVVSDFGAFSARGRPREPIPGGNPYRMLLDFDHFVVVFFAIFRRCLDVFAA